MGKSLQNIYKISSHAHSHKANSFDLQQKNIFNQYFASVGTNVAKTIQPIDRINYTNMHISESIFIQSICVDEVLLHIDLLDSQKPVTLKHDIHVRIMKISKYMLSPIPTIIFNNYNCIVKGIYPDALARGISRLGSAFIFLRWFKLAHICIQVTSLRMWNK